MTPEKCEALMQGHTNIAKKVYECVPIGESWRAFQIMSALRNMTGSTADVRIVQGCLRDLVDSGLIKKTGSDHYQRIAVEKKQKPKEQKMPAAKAEKVATVPPAKAAGQLEILGELSAEILVMAEHLKRLASRVEDAALAAEQEREASSKQMEQFRQLKALLKGLQGEEG